MRIHTTGEGSLFPGTRLWSTGFGTTGGLTTIGVWGDSSWIPIPGGTNGGHSDMEVFNGDIYVSGWFSGAAYVPSRGIIRVSADGAWSTVGGGVVDGSVYELAAYKGALYAAGPFNQSVGSLGFAKWDGASWSDVTGPAGWSVSDVVVFNGRLVVALQYNFHYWSGLLVGSASLAEFDGTTWSWLGGSADPNAPAGPVYDLSVRDGLLYVGGDFDTVGPAALPASDIAAWNGSSWSALGTGALGPFGSSVQHVEALPGGVYASGDFAFMGGVPVPGFARWDGNAWSAVGDGAFSMYGPFSEYDEDGAGGDPPSLFGCGTRYGCPLPTPEFRIEMEGSPLGYCGTVAFGTTYIGFPVERAFTIFNDGEGALALTAVGLPSGLEYGTAPPATIAAGGSASFTIRNPALSQQNASACCWSVLYTNDSDESHFPMCLSWQVLPLSTEVDLQLSAPPLSLDSFGGNAYATTTYTIWNASSTAASTTRVSIPVPAGVSVVGVSPSTGSFQFMGGSLIWNLGMLASLADESLRIDLDTTMIGDYTIGATATASNNTNDPTPWNNSLYYILTYTGDCNANGLEDWLDILNGEPDSDGNLVPEVCQAVVTGYCHPEYDYPDYPAATDATVAAVLSMLSDYCDGDERAPAISLNPRAALSNPVIDFRGFAQGLWLYGLLGLDFIQPAHGQYSLGNGSRIVHPGPHAVELNGRVSVDFDDSVRLGGALLRIGETGELLCAPESRLEFETWTSVALDLRGYLEFLGASISSGRGITVASTGLLEGFGILATPITVGSGGEARYLADTQAIEDYANHGTTTIQNGTLTILGTLLNTGTIIGDFAAARSAEAPDWPRAAGDGMFVRGDFAAGAASSLRFVQAGSRAAFGGSFDCAINSNGRFDLASAEVRMVGTGAAEQRLEAMSRDRGPVEAGFDRSQTGSYPLGTLRIGPTPTTVRLVDGSDNDGSGQAEREAVYVDMLIVDEGATLINIGIRVYCRVATIEGAVADPAGIVLMVPPALCNGDANGDGVVNFADITKALENWLAAYPGPTCNGAGDADHDCDVDFGDITEVLEHWLAVCDG